METPEEGRVGGRARRAVPVIAAALVAIVLAALVYLRGGFPAIGSHVQTLEPVVATMEPSYQVAYDFLSPTLGWAAVARPAGAEVEYWVFVTSDATTHWRLQTTGALESEASVEIQFFDRTHGYAVVGRSALLETSDGGAIWVRTPLPSPPLFAITFSDPQHGWLEGGDSFTSGTPPASFPFYETADGGAHWTPLPTPPGGVFAFRNWSEGWTADISEAGGTVYSTHDGGATWTAHPLPSTGIPNEDGLIEPTEVRLLPGHGVMVTTATFAFTSMDGDTWRSVVAPPGARFFDMAFQDASHWWVMPSGNLFKTSDGGRTWNHVSLQFDDWQYRLQVVDGRHAWARLDLSVGTQDPTRGTALAVTTDGGVHWDYANVPRPPA